MARANQALLAQEGTLDEEIALERRRLAALDHERAATLLRIAALEARSTASSPKEASVLTKPARIHLFRSLFRGRDNVLAKRWESKKSGKSGYSPACSNEWVSGVCEKPRIACAECSRQAFVGMTDDVVLGHLQGRHTIGLYPLLQDDTCWFLAVDFDGLGWQEDAAAFLQTARQNGATPALERSRSGNGAHVWFFFASPVSATVARKMGCYLLTRTMDRHYRIKMSSYDRLFPNQDTMPKGGFGNLIALPLQREPRYLGNSVFLDENFEPHEDQWTFLQSIGRMSVEAVSELASEGERRRLIVGARLEEEDLDQLAPWERPPSGPKKDTPLPLPLPKVVKAVLCQRLFVETKGLSSRFLARLKQMAAFQNPEFYKLQSLRLSTALTPRVISCSEEFEEHLAVPRGCLVELQEKLDQACVPLELIDKRSAGEQFEFSFNGELKDEQRVALQSLASEDIGILVAPPGFGKTVLGAALIAQRRCSTLVLVHRQPLVEQWVQQLAHFLGLKPKDIGQIGGGRRRPNGRLDVVMIQSLVRGAQFQDLVENYGQIIVDECHHIPAVSFEKVVATAKARYVTGLTATPRRKDGHHPILEMQLGPVRFRVDSKRQAAQRPFGHRLVVRHTQLKSEPGLAIQELYARVVQDEGRNELIVRDVLASVQTGRSPIVLTQRRAHLEDLTRRLTDRVPHLFVLHGGMSRKRRQGTLEQIAACSGEGRLVLATGPFVGEGFDDARLDTLFLTMPIAWKGTLIQYAGRLHRLHPDKREVHIYDYVDSGIHVFKKMFQKRMLGYQSIGYSSGGVDQLELS